MKSIPPPPPRVHDSPSASRPLRILLVDDQRTTRLATQHLLRHLTCEADVASGGAEALECLGRREYDVVLMDLLMPGMGGLEATRHLRKLLGPRRPRVVALTADDTQEDRDSCRAAGMDDFIPKPLTRARLIQALGPAGPPPGLAEEWS